MDRSLLCNQRDVPLPERIYLDHAATTPILPEAAAAMTAALADWANPSSPHAEGRAAHARMEDSRRRIVAALGWAGSLVFTSGATEAISIAIAGAKADRLIVSPTEHQAVLRLAGKAWKIRVRSDGIVDLDDLSVALQSGRKALVAVQQVNNETGVVQPLDRIGALVRDYGGLLLADCAQSAGKLPLPEADLIAISAHKLGGPPGIGALLVRDETMLEAAGGQEGGFRAGTPNLPAILGFAAALEVDRGWYQEAERLRARLDRAIGEAGGEIAAVEAPRAATIGCYRMPGVAGAAQLMQLDLAGIAVSTGSACSSGSLKPSHVLMAMSWSEEEARETIRVSFGRQTTEPELEALIAEWRALHGKRRAA
jgi:cysteine desulfurase